VAGGLLTCPRAIVNGSDHEHLQPTAFGGLIIIPPPEKASKSQLIRLWKNV
jgi:hypothetical protein